MISSNFLLFVFNLPLWKANRNIADAGTSVISDAFIMGLPEMRVFNVFNESDRHTKSEVPSPLPIGKMHKQGLLLVPSYGDVYSGNNAP
jgi:hypothetical protein